MSKPGVMASERVKLSLVQAFFWAAMVCPSLTSMYLASRGFSPKEVGDMAAALALVSIVFQPVWGIISDRLRSARGVFIICMTVSATVWVLSPTALSAFGLAFVWLLWPLSRVFLCPLGSLLDSLVARTVARDRGAAYGSIRLFGAVGYALMGTAITSLIAFFGNIDVMFYGFAVMTAATCAVVFFVGDERASVRRVRSFRELKVGALLKRYPYWTFLLFCVTLNIPVSAGINFMPYLLRSIGQENLSVMGAIVGLKALFEVPVFLASGRLIRRFHPGYLLVAAGSGYAIEMMLYAFCRDVYQVFAVQCFHGLMFGLFLSCQVQYAHSLAPGELSATAQTLSGAAMAFAGIIANTLGGRLFVHIGVRPFYLSAGVLQVLSLALFSLSLKNTRRLQAAEAAGGA